MTVKKTDVNEEEIKQQLRDLIARGTLYVPTGGQNGNVMWDGFEEVPIKNMCRDYLKDELVGYVDQSLPIERRYAIVEEILKEKGI